MRVIASWSFVPVRSFWCRFLTIRLFLCNSVGVNSNILSCHPLLPNYFWKFCIDSANRLQSIRYQLVTLIWNFLDRFSVLIPFVSSLIEGLSCVNSFSWITFSSSCLSGIVWRKCWSKVCLKFLSTVVFRHFLKWFFSKYSLSSFCLWVNVEGDSCSISVSKLLCLVPTDFKASGAKPFRTKTRHNDFVLFCPWHPSAFHPFSITSRNLLVGFIQFMYKNYDGLTIYRIPNFRLQWNKNQFLDFVEGKGYIFESCL